jgi:site-specific DNA-methyltransferase (cytosine-N4-specific)
MINSVIYTTQQVAEMAGVHKDTLLRWLREGRVSEPGRDRNGWRVFTPEETRRVVEYTKGAFADTAPVMAEKRVGYTPHLPYAEALPRLEGLNWDFAAANTGYLTHAMHPYPAKFIPQIPNTLIQELSAVGETVLDPFCGSGTSLVEARRLGRHALGVDANPLACLISRAKASCISESEREILLHLANEIQQSAQQSSIGRLPLFPDLPAFPTPLKRHTFEGIGEWFDEHVIDELSFIKEKCSSLRSTRARQLALVAFSSIIVTVSRQDSDTRYVRRDKQIKPGETLQLFSRALVQASRCAFEFSQEVDPRLTTQVFEANLLDAPNVGPVDLVVCSPPYPNAYSYHLYHRTRMLWLEMDQPKFKRQEIGSHRKYSSKGVNAATIETFRAELRTILTWLRGQLRPNRHACFVIGDSTLKGEIIRNDELLIEVARETGFRVEANLNRELQSTKKYFNPKIGKIKDEHLVILRNVEEGHNG